MKHDETPARLNSCKSYVEEIGRSCVRPQNADTCRSPRYFTAGKYTENMGNITWQPGSYCPYRLPEGLEKEHWIVLLFRIIAWAALYFVPVHVVAVCNLRSFAFYGISPGDSCLVWWRIGFGPAIIREVVEDMGLSHRPWISRGVVFAKAIQWLHMTACASTWF